MLTFSFGWPQFVMAAIYVFDLVYAAMMHGKQRENYNVWATLLGCFLSFVILYAGGFWGCN